jgi:phenylalanyl-tRNA synthetase beta chain
VKLSLSWLKDFVDITLSPDALAERLTLAGMECESITRIGEFWDRDKVFVGQILEVLRHPEADRLTLVRVDYGAGVPMTVVTGAPNMLPYLGVDLSGGRGPKVAYAMSGARLVDGHSEERRIVKLKPSKIRGIMSEGMVCSEKELDLSDAHEGNLVLPDDAPVGMPLIDYLGDTVLEFDIKGPAGHLQSVAGFAREIAALTAQPMRKSALTTLERKPVEIVPDSPFAGIVISDPDLCLRYSAALIQGVSIGPSPLWMQQRLQRAGMRPISNVVDVTNYVMLELGQPLHAFDYDLLTQRAVGGRPTIIMRRARPGERTKTLDGVDRALDPNMLLITDMAGPVAIGGVMGGAETEIHDGTRTILLESANFNFLSIRRTSQLLNLPSEAARRFGKRVDPELTVKALARACELLDTLAGGKTQPVYGDVYPAKPTPLSIELNTGITNRLLGIKIPAAEQAEILRSLDFEVFEPEDMSPNAMHFTAESQLRVAVPSFRQDVSIPADLVEEIGRIYGYDRMPRTLLEDELPVQPRNLALEGEEKVRDIMVGSGLNEVITYSMVDIKAETRFLAGGVARASAVEPHVTVLNPLSAERGHLRRTLLPSLVETTRANLRFQERVAVFEIGRVYIPQPEEILPAEPRRLSALLVGPREPSTWLSHDVTSMGFFDLKGVVEALAKRLGLAELTWERGSRDALHPGRTALAKLNGVEVGVLGELHPRLRASLDLPDLPVAVMELDLEALLQHWGAGNEMTEISAQPAVYEDLALLLNEDVPAEQVARLIRQSGGKLLVDVRLFDVYRGGQVPAGKKSLAYSLTFQAADRTLTADDTAKAREKIVGRLDREVGAMLRA